MSCKIDVSPICKREIKRLSKKYRSLRNDIKLLVQELEENPKLGTELHPGIRKVRIAIASKGKGKSGGARLITVIIDSSNPPSALSLLYIYDKSEMSTITDKQIEDLLGQMT